MADVVSPAKRSLMMAGIKGKNTKPELAIRKALHHLGFRYRLHVKELPGKPDLVFSQYNAVIFINGCFWHGHNCHLFKWPSSRVEFWREKIERNQEVDRENMEKLEKAGWRIACIWECAVKGKTKRIFMDVIEECCQWLFSNEKKLEIRGKI